MATETVSGLVEVNNKYATDHIQLQYDRHHHVGYIQHIIHYTYDVLHKQVINMIRAMQT